PRKYRPVRVFPVEWRCSYLRHRSCRTRLHQKRPLMKRLLLIPFTAFLASTATDALAQDKQYDDLLVRYVDEKYEDCLVRAERYTQGDKTKKDPLPFLYMSMCLYEMSK